MRKSPPGFYPLDRFRRSNARPEPVQARVVVFGFAGGTITSLLSLAEAFPPAIEVWGAEYPGRGLRWQRPAITDIDSLIDDFAPGLANLSDLPLILLGYSMGAHVAYRVGLRLPVAPRAMVAMSARPPHCLATDWPTSPQSDAELIARLSALGGMPAEILGNQQLLALFLPVVRADLALCHDLNRFTPMALPCPVLAMQGDQDNLLKDSGIARWLDVAGGNRDLSRQHVWSGGHFFHKGREQENAELVCTWLQTLDLLQDMNHRLLPA